MAKFATGPWRWSSGQRARLGNSYNIRLKNGITVLCHSFLSVEAAFNSCTASKLGHSYNIRLKNGITVLGHSFSSVETAFNSCKSAYRSDMLDLKAFEVVERRSSSKKFKYPKWHF